MKLRVSPERRVRLADAGKRAGGNVAAGLNRVFGSRARGRFGILLYHRVVPAPHDGQPPFETVSPAQFRAQVEGLLERGIHFARLADVIDASLRGDSIPPETSVVTFDDGYANVFEYACPILADLGVPATVFVATAYIGSADPFPFDAWTRVRPASVPVETWRPLDWAECEEMQASGLIDIGSHTHTHADFRGRPDAFEQDVSRSLELLERHLGPGPRPFAFPFGNVTKGFAGPELADAARRAGVTCGLTTELELVDAADDPFTWGRVEAVASDTASVCAAKLAGWYGWMGTSRRAFQRLVSR